MLNSPNNLSFKFGAKFVEIDKKLTLAWNAINALNDRVNNAPAFNIGEELEALNSRITANTEDITELDETKADTSYVDSSITTVNNSIAGVSSKVTTNEGNISSLDTSLDALTTRVTTNEGNIEKYGEWIDNLVTSVAHGKTEPFNDFHKHLFDMIYPIGSIYTTVTDTPPPNIITDSSNILPDSAFSPTIDTTDPYWNGRLSTWKLLETGYFLRNLGTDEAEKLGTTGGSTNVARHMHTVTGNAEKLYGALLTEPDVSTYGLFNGASSNTIIQAGANITSTGNSVYPEKIYVEGRTDTSQQSRYTTITFDPTQITISEMDAATHPEEQIPPYEYVYMYQRVK